MKKPYLIAEAAKEHEGSLTLSKSMIDEAKRVGFDAIKFQSYDLNDLIDTHTNYERYKRCHLTLNQLKELKDYADNKEIDFFVSVFSESLIKPLSTFLSDIKIPSTYLTYPSYVDQCISNFNTTHISTGFHSLDTVTKYYTKYSKPNVVFYHCTSLYPPSDNTMRLSRINNFNFQGFSCHTDQVDIPIVAWLRYDLEFIEIHFSLIQSYKKHIWYPYMMEGLVKSMDRMIEICEDTPITQEEKDNLEKFKGEFKSLK